MHMTTERREPDKQMSSHAKIPHSPSEASSDGSARLSRTALSQTIEPFCTRSTW
jgi:hypothetical protein